jgi:hypothetical protein
MRLCAGQTSGKRALLARFRATGRTADGKGLSWAGLAVGHGRVLIPWKKSIVRMGPTLSVRYRSQACDGSLSFLFPGAVTDYLGGVVSPSFRISCVPCFPSRFVPLLPAIIPPCAGVLDCRGKNKSSRSTLTPFQARKISGLLVTALLPPSLSRSSARIRKSLAENYL